MGFSMKIECFRVFFDDFRGFFSSLKNRLRSRKRLKSLDFRGPPTMKNLGSFREKHFFSTFSAIRGLIEGIPVVIQLACDCGSSTHKTTRAATCGPPGRSEHIRNRSALRCAIFP
jgi:hypothetical protein